MTSRFSFQYSNEVKDVIHVKVKKYAGFFDPQCKRFAIDPRVTTFGDLKNILIGAFNLDGPFHISYLCRDDAGESVYLTLLTEWDMDAAFLTSSDPYLRLKVEAEPSHGIQQEEPLSSPRKTKRTANTELMQIDTVTPFQFPQALVSSVGQVLNKITSGIGYNSDVHESRGISFFPSRPRLGDREFHEYLDDRGCLTRPEDLRLRIYHSGIESSLRKVAWRLLLNIFPKHLSGKERISYMKRKTDEYEKLCTAWRSLFKQSYVQELSKMIWKDVLRTDRTHIYFAGSDCNPHLIALYNLLLTYALTHHDTRYCQGMSDIAAPILVVMDNEAHAYVCFCGLMTRLNRNFCTSGEVMTGKFEHLSLLVRYHDPDFFEFLKSLEADNMFFCYRWLLLEMKREFCFEDSLTVLEVMWSSLPPQPPDDDLSLGTIDIREDRNHVKDGQHLKKKFDSLPQLILDSRSLCLTSATAASLPNIQNLPTSTTDLFSKNAKSFHCENLYFSDEEDAMHSHLWILGGNPINGRTFCNSSHSTSCESRNRMTLFSDDAVKKNIPERIKQQKDVISLPPPEEFGFGNPFLLFICLSILLDQREELMSSNREYDDLVMHFDHLARKHSVSRIISKAMELFAAYLQSQSSVSSKIDT